MLEFPETDKWGAIVPKDHPLASKETVCVDDLIGLPLFVSEQSWNADIPRWAGAKMKDLKAEGFFQLSYNGAIFAGEGLGVLLTLDHLINTGSESDLAFIPFDPPLENKMYLVWKKYQVFSPIAEKFLPVVINYLRYFLPFAQITAPSGAIPDDLVQFLFWHPENRIILQDDLASAFAAACFPALDPVHVFPADRPDLFQRIDHPVDRRSADLSVLL